MTTSQSRGGPGIVGWILIALVLAGSAPGVIQTILRLNALSGVNWELVGLDDFDWLTGLLSSYGPRLSIVPLVVVTVLKRIHFKYKILLWVVFLLSLLGLLLFGQDVERAFGSSPK